MRKLTLTGLSEMPEIVQGAKLAPLLIAAITQANETLQANDVLVIAQKIVSKSEGRQILLADVTPSARAIELADKVDKDARLVELILRESREVLRAKRGVLIVEHHLGFVLANAGIDQSNVPGDEVDAVALLLPLNPDASAGQLQADLRALCGVEIGIVINDSFGRPWRNGVAGTAIGVAGIPALVDMRGSLDREGRVLRVTQVAAADELAAAASLVMGQGDEGCPAVLARGFPYQSRESSASELLRARSEDLFR